MKILLLICSFCIHIYLQKKINSGEKVSKANLLVNLIHSFAYFYILSLALIGIVEFKPFWMTLTDEQYNYWRNIFFYIFLAAVLIEPLIQNKKVTGKIYKIISSDVFLYIEVTIISVIAFCSIYGTRIIDPTNVEWQMAFGEDLAQHYLGWKAYRSSQWHFPIGMIDNLAYPTLVSVMFTDSIPLLSVFFKIFSFALPEQFQFFGIWGLLCVVLQGCFAAKIMKRFTSSKWMIIDASILFVFTPVMIQRLRWHISLASQWLILMSFLPLIYPEKFVSPKRKYAYIALIGFLAGSIHLYFALMCGFVVIGICLQNYLTNKNFLQVGCILAVYILTIAVVLGILGGFAPYMRKSGGFYGNNISLFNPNGWSIWFQNWDSFGEGENFAWLGGGMVFMLFLACVLYLNNPSRLKNYRPMLLAISVAALISFFFALSPNILFGNKSVLESKIPYFNFITNIIGIFRCYGRMIWVAIYAIMIFCVLVTAETLNQNTAKILLLCVLAMQIYDLHAHLNVISEQYHSEIKYETRLSDKAFWNAVQANDVQHVVLVSVYDENNAELPNLYALTDWALDNHLTMNEFYFARGIHDLIDENREAALQNPSDDTLFIFSDVSECVNYGLNCYTADGLTVGYTQLIDGYEKVLSTDLTQ